MTLSQSRFAGKVCVVTGAAGGIGRATALGFAREGGKVAILDMNSEGAAETLSLIENLGGEGIALTCDTTDPEAVEAARAAVAERFGDPDVLVNNAGIGKFIPLIDTTLEEWNRVISVNVTGYFICVNAFGHATLASVATAFPRLAPRCLPSFLPPNGGRLACAAMQSCQA